MVNSVRPSVVGCKLTNIYDINSRIYILKLARTGFKCFLLLESGVRFHLTNYERDKSSVPSNFTMKLRKHIRTRRLTAIEQLGCDRVIDITFGRGDNAFHLILELFSGGNVLCTDHEYRIVALLRAHNDQQGTKVVALKEIYPMEAATGLLKVPISEFQGAIDELLNLVSQRAENQEIQEIEAEDEKAKGKKGADSAFAKRSKKRVDHSSMPLVQLLHKLVPFADPALCAASLSRALKQADIPCPNAFKFAADDLPFDKTVEMCQRAAELTLQTLQSVSRPCDLGGGFMPTLEAVEEGEDQDFGDDEDAPEEEKPAQDAEADDETIVPGWILRRHVHVPPTDPYWANEEFTPLCPDVADPDALVDFPTFHRCVDEFYTKVEEHRAAEQKAQHAKSVYDKVDKIRIDQGRRVEELEKEQEVRERQAALIEANVELVEFALTMVNTMVASQIDWGELWKEVKRQQRLGHPIAQHIHALDLEHNEVLFLLTAPKREGDDSDEEEDDRAMEVVPLDLNLSPHANVAKLHTKRKETREKTSRTVVHAESAVKQAEKKAEKDLQKFQLKQTIRRVRQNWWFEKYFWFISSENYLVVAGHDTQQIEHIFARHLGSHDVFVQADVAGARTCFVRNPGGGLVPPATLREAGTMALCHSTAWDKHIIISAWSVPVEQVSRGGPPPEGDFLLVDGFFVRGRRDFMPPLQLEMGLTVIFHVADASASRHRGERRSRYLEAMGDPNAVRDDSGDDDGEDEELVVEDGDEQQGFGKDAAHSQVADDALGKVAEDMGVSNKEGADKEDEQDEEDEEEEEGGDEVAKPFPSESGAAEERGADDEEGGEGGKKERISKAERKKIKKGGDDADTPSSSSFQPPSRASEKSSKGAQPGVAAAKGKAKAEPSAKLLPRGQKAKAKKMKEKYGDQDEDERQLRLALLGSKETKFQASSTSAAPAPVAAAEPDDAVADGGDGEGAAAAAEGPGSSTAAAEDPTAAPKQPKADKKEWLPRPKNKEARLTAGCDAEDRGPLDTQLAQLELLTGQPQPEDEVLYAMAMVAPYCSLTGPYTYRAKLTPGPGKKGQVLKQCIRMFEQQIDKKAWQILVQAIPENEATCLMMGSCKASMPGMQKLQKHVRKDMKKDKQDGDGGAPKPQGGKPKK